MTQCLQPAAWLRLLLLIDSLLAIRMELARAVTDCSDELPPAPLAPDRRRHRLVSVSARPAARGHTLPVAPFRRSVRLSARLFVGPRCIDLDNPQLQQLT